MAQCPPDRIDYLSLDAPADALQATKSTARKHMASGVRTKLPEVTSLGSGHELNLQLGIFVSLFSLQGHYFFLASIPGPCLSVFCSVKLQWRGGVVASFAAL